MSIATKTIEEIVRDLDPRERIVAGVIAREVARGDGYAELSRIEIAEMAGMAINDGSLARVSTIAGNLAKLGLITVESRVPMPTAYTAVAGLKEATRNALPVPGLTPGESWVLCNLEDYAETRPDDLPSPERIAASLGISRRTFDRIVAKLEYGGWLTVARNEYGRALIYRLNTR